MRTIQPDSEAIVEYILFTDAIDACLYPALEHYGKVSLADHGQEMLILPAEYVSNTTITLPDGTEIDIIRNRGLVYLHDWRLDLEFDDA